MLTAGDRILLEIPDEYALIDADRRVLYAGHILEASDGFYSTEIMEHLPKLEEGAELNLYYELRRQFMKQPVRIDSLTQEALQTVIQLETTGNPILAEQRESYRVSAIAAGVTARFGEEANCKVLDVSAAGFSLYAAKQHQVGSALDVVLFFKGQQFSDRALIQSARKLGKSKIRYGLKLVEQGGSGVFKLSLPKLNLAIQRQQMARRSGAR